MVGRRLRSIHFPAALLVFVLALASVPLAASAGSGTLVQDGNEFYDAVGNATSLVYPDGVLIGNSTNASYARYQFAVNSAPPTYNLSLSLYYTGTSGNGPTISLFNWTSSSWDMIATDIGTGENLTYSVNDLSLYFIEAAGTVGVEVSVEVNESADIGTVGLDWMYDETPPSNPNDFSAIPSPGTWTSDNTIYAEWSGAYDDYSGIGGYSVIWDQSPDTLPGTAINSTAANSTSPSLADGTWYLHVRTVDGSGNWNSSAYHIGPFMIDATAPSNPSGNDSDPLTDTWSSDNTVSVSWTGAADAGGGVQGYSYTWSQDSSTIPDATVDTTDNDAVSPALADGTWYLHIRTVDNAGNWNAEAYHVGPFRIDTVAPTNPVSNSSDPVTGVWTNDTTVTVEWSGASDLGSGVQGYSVEWSQDPSTVPDQIADPTGATTTSPSLTDGTWYLHVRSVDNASLWASDAYHIGPFLIDATAPGSPNVQGPPAWSNDTTPYFNWTAPSDASGILGYSYVMDALPDEIVDTSLLNVTWTSLPDGPHIFYVRTADLAGNWGAASSYSFSIDTVLPSLAIVAPTDGTIQNSTTVDVTWTGGDGLSGIDHFEILMDSGSPVDVGTNLAYQFTSVPDGPHSITVVAVDAAGNVANGTIAIIVDTVAPSLTLSIEGTVGSNGWYVSPVNVTINANDNTTSVANVMYNLDSGGWQIYTVPIPISENGNHSLQYFALDLAGNNNSASAEIRIDTMQFYFLFNVLNSTVFNSNYVAVAWTVYNAVSGIDHFEYSLDGGAFQNLGSTASVGLVNVSEGSHILVVIAFDNAGNQAERSLWFTVDTQPPSLEFDVPDGEMFNSTPFAIGWLSEDETTEIAYFSYSLDGGQFVSNGNESSIVFSEISEGNHFLTVRAYDLAGNFAALSLSFVVDTIPPALEFDSQGAAYFDSGTVTVTWTASDAVSGIDRYEYSLDGGAFVQSGTAATLSLDLAGLSEGAHVLILRVFDVAGNVAEESLDVIVDTEPPTLAFGIENGTAFTSRPVIVSWTSTDNNSGIDRFEYSLDGGPTIDLGTTMSVSISSISEGDHVLTVGAYDRAGNAVTGEVSFLVDSQPPSIDFDIPNGFFFNTSSPVINWSAADETAGIDYFEYSLNGAPFVSIGNATSLSLQGLTDRTHLLTVRAYDGVGNMAESSLIFIVDTRPPSLSFEIDDGFVFKSSVAVITWLSQDSGSGIWQFEYSLDGGDFLYIGNGTSLRLTDLRDGSHVLVLRAYDQAGNFVEKSITFQVNTFGLWIFALVVIANVIVVLVYVLRRKK